MSARRQLPAGLVAYKQTPTFSAETLPAALQRAHTTRAGVWGRIVVSSGRVRYVIEETGEAVVLSPGVDGVVIPQEPHHLELMDGPEPLAVYVEFLRPSASA